MIAPAALLWLVAVAADGGSASMEPERAPEPGAPSVDECKLAILRPTLLNMRPTDAYLADLVADVLAVEVGRASTCEIVTEADIESMLAFEGQKQSLGCDADAPSCLSEIGDALGVDEVVTGSITRAGARYALSLRRVDVANARVTSRAQRFSAPTPEALSQAAREGVVELVGADSVTASAPIVEEAEEPSVFGPVLLWGGVAGLAVGAVIALGFGGTGGIAWLVKENPSGDGNVRYAASVAWIPLVVVGGLGLLVVGAGGAALGASFAL